MLERIDHIGIAVKDLEQALGFYEKKLGLKCTSVEEVAEQKVRVAFLPLGESKIELLEPTDPAGPVGAFLAQKGPGVHHLSLAVDNLKETLKNLEKEGVALIDKEPRIGAGGAKIAFVHPRATGGILLELCEH